MNHRCKVAQTWWSAITTHRGIFQPKIRIPKTCLVVQLNAGWFSSRKSTEIILSVQVRCTDIIKGHTARNSAWLGSGTIAEVLLSCILISSWYGCMFSPSFYNAPTGRSTRCNMNNTLRLSLRGRGFCSSAASVCLHREL